MDPNLKVSEVIELYEGIAEWAEICINQDDIVTAQECKKKIAEFMFRMISEGYNRPKMRLYGKFHRLEIKLTKYILLGLRSEYVELESPDEED